MNPSLRTVELGAFTMLYYDISFTTNDMQSDVDLYSGS